MRTSVKAALAGVAGVGLLLGGAGSLAFWNDTETQDGGTIQAGTLNLTDADCGDGWLVTGTTTKMDLFADDFRIIPGTSVTRVCTFTLRVSGDVTGTLTLDSAPAALDAHDEDTTLKDELLYTATYDLSGTAGQGVSGVITEGQQREFTELDDGKVLTASITVELPLKPTEPADNDSNSLVGDQVNGVDRVSLKAMLDAVTVSVEQAHPQAQALPVNPT